MLPFGDLEPGKQQPDPLELRAVSKEPASAVLIPSRLHVPVDVHRHGVVGRVVEAHQKPDVVLPSRKAAAEVERRAALLPIETGLFDHHGKPRAAVRFRGKMLPYDPSFVACAPCARALFEGVLRFETDFIFGLFKDAAPEEREKFLLLSCRKAVTGRSKCLVALLVGNVQAVDAPISVPRIGELDGRDVLCRNLEPCKRIALYRRFLYGRNSFIGRAFGQFGAELRLLYGSIPEVQRDSAEREIAVDCLQNEGMLARRDVRESTAQFFAVVSYGFEPAGAPLVRCKAFELLRRSVEQHADAHAARSVERKIARKLHGARSRNGLCELAFQARASRLRLHTGALHAVEVRYAAEAMCGRGLHLRRGKSQPRIGRGSDRDERFFAAVGTDEEGAVLRCSRERDKDARFRCDLPFRFGERKEGAVVFDGKGEAPRAAVEDLEPLGLDALFIECEAG